MNNHTIKPEELNHFISEIKLASQVEIERNKKLILIVSIENNKAITNYQVTNYHVIKYNGDNLIHAIEVYNNPIL